MKKLIKTVKLKFFCDSANGEYGLTHEDTIDSDTSFNAFWNGIGIFHDVFEHSHEYTNKYFRGDYAMNVGGEMAAMGSLYYFTDVLGMCNRLRQGYRYRTNAEVMKEETLSTIKEALYSGYCNFGYSLESNVPKQRPIKYNGMEEQISAYWSEVKEFKDTNNQGEQEKEFAQQYRDSITFRKIADLHRYGFRMAERFVPDTSENRDTMEEFIQYWDGLCKDNDPEEMARMFRGLTFRIYKDKGEISWTATFESADIYQIKDVRVKPGKRFDAEDAEINEYN